MILHHSTSFLLIRRRERERKDERGREGKKGRNEIERKEIKSKKKK
jgi:hypothetical protein